MAIVATNVVRMTSIPHFKDRRARSAPTLGARSTLSYRLLAARLFTKMPVQELLRKLDALVFEHLHIFFQTTIEGHSHLPGSREHLRVLDGRLVRHRVRTDARVPLDHMQGVAVEVPRPIEPGVLVEAGHVDDQRLALPAAARPSHPRVRGTLRLAVHPDDAA